MTKTLLIFNPSSDRGRSGQRASDLRGMVEELGGADWVGTEYPTHATKLAAEAALNGYQRVVALGGDGTVHEVVNGLMKIDALQRPQLGIVPIGSGNDFAAGVGLALDPQQAMRRALSGEPHAVDVGLIRDNAGRLEYFDNTCGIGFDATVNIYSRRIHNLQGFTMYLVATLQTIFLSHNPIPMKVTYDDGVIDEKLLLFTLGNGPREGGGFQTTPAAKVDDGQLDWVCIKDISRLRMLLLVPKVMNATHIHEKDVRLGRARRLTIEAEGALPIHLDGEMWASFEANVRRVEISTLPGALQLVM